MATRARSTMPRLDELDRAEEARAARLDGDRRARRGLVEPRREVLLHRVHVRVQIDALHDVEVFSAIAHDTGWPANV